MSLPYASLGTASIKAMLNPPVVLTALPYVGLPAARFPVLAVPKAARCAVATAHHGAGLRPLRHRPPRRPPPPQRAASSGPPGTRRLVRRAGARRATHRRVPVQQSSYSLAAAPTVTAPGTGSPAVSGLAHAISAAPIVVNSQPPPPLPTPPAAVVVPAPTVTPTAATPAPTVNVSVGQGIPRPARRACRSPPPAHLGADRVDGPAPPRAPRRIRRLARAPRATPAASTPAPADATPASTPAATPPSTPAATPPSTPAPAPAAHARRRRGLNSTRRRHRHSGARHRHVGPRGHGHPGSGRPGRRQLPQPPRPPTSGPGGQQLGHDRRACARIIGSDPGRRTQQRDPNSARRHRRAAAGHRAARLLAIAIGRSSSARRPTARRPRPSAPAGSGSSGDQGSAAVRPPLVRLFAGGHRHPAAGHGTRHFQPVRVRRRVRHRPRGDIAYAGTAGVTDGTPPPRRSTPRPSASLPPPRPRPSPRPPSSSPWQPAARRSSPPA